MVSATQGSRLGSPRRRRRLVVLSLLIIVAFSAYYYVDRYVRLVPSTEQTAATALEEQVRRVPNDAGLRSKLAQAYADEFKYDKAVEQYQASIKITADNPVAYLGLGNTYFAQKDFASAEDAYQKVIDYYQDKPFRTSLQPLNFMYYNLGIMYQQQNRLDDAANSLEEALKIQRSDADALYQLAQVRLHQGNSDESIKDCAEAVRYIPDFTEAYQVMAQAYAQLGQNDLHQYAQGMVSYSRQDYEGAVTLLAAAAKALPDQEPVQVGLAMALEKAGKQDQALVSFQAAQKLNPDDVLANWGVQRLSPQPAPDQTGG